MHIPDGFVSGQINAAAFAVTAAVGAVAVAKAKKSLKEKQVPLLGITAAFVFAAQMLNFPIAGGTSGHFLGALLAMILLGPLNGFLVMSIVITVQCLVFADGGITALGTNIFNMGLIAGLGGYVVFRFLLAVLPFIFKGGTLGDRDGKSNKAGEVREVISSDVSGSINMKNPERAGWLLPSVAVASWFSVVTASAFCALELALSGTSPFGIVFPAMVGVHSLIGIGEAVITTGVVSIVFAARPELMPVWGKVLRTRMGDN